MRKLIGPYFKSRALHSRRDASQPVDPARKRPHPLAPSIDHVLPVSHGGTHTRRGVQITHWFCNHGKNAYRSDRGTRSVEFMRAKLAQRLHGTPIPEALWRAKFSRWSTRHEYMLALKIELGDLAAEPGSEPARSRLRRIARACGIVEQAFKEDLARMRAHRSVDTCQALSVVRISPWAGGDRQPPVAFRGKSFARVAPTLAPRYASSGAGLREVTPRRWM